MQLMFAKHPHAPFAGITQLTGQEHLALQQLYGTAGQGFAAAAMLYPTKERTCDYYGRMAVAGSMNNTIATTTTGGGDGLAYTKTGVKATEQQQQQGEVRSRRRRITHSLVASMDPLAVARRNERERNRVRQVNDGFDALRRRIPVLPEKKKLSKVEILRFAMTYIRELQELIRHEGDHHTAGDYMTTTTMESLKQEDMTDEEMMIIEEEDEDVDHHQNQRRQRHAMI